MLHTTDHDLPRASPRTAFGCVSRTALGLSILGLLGLTAQGALAAPIQIVKQMDLVFGRYATSETQGGTVTINPATNGKTVTGGVQDFGGPHQRAQFEITGDTDEAYAVTLPSQITISAGGDSMTVNAFTWSGTGVLEFDVDTIWVGATLNLTANQPPGLYTGQFTVTVEYN